MKKNGAGNIQTTNCEKGICYSRQKYANSRKTWTGKITKGKVRHGLKRDRGIVFPLVVTPEPQSHRSTGNTKSYGKHRANVDEGGRAFLHAHGKRHAHAYTRTSAYTPTRTQARARAHATPVIHPHKECERENVNERRTTNPPGKFLKRRRSPFH